MNQRITWAQLPRKVREGVENILGDAVIEAVSQSGGFSPGSADRVRLASGRRAFVKAVCADVNATTPDLHRREAAVTSALPPGVLAPDFLGMYDDGTWVALILADVAGWHPQEPWVEAEVLQVLDAVAGIGEIELPADVELPLYEDSLRSAFRGWERLQARPLAGMDPWAGAHMSQLVELAHQGTEYLSGESLVHGDLRADNILITDQGVVFVDWPWAARGAAWVEGLSVLLNVKTLDPETSVEHFFADHRVFADTTAHAITAVMAGWAGYFLDMSRRPAPPGIPTLRAFQRRQADALIDWIQARGL